MALEFTDFIGFKLALAAEEKRHKRALARLEQKRKEIEKACPHPESMQDFNADPAGDTSESFYRCRLCGKEY